MRSRSGCSTSPSPWALSYSGCCRFEANRALLRRPVKQQGDVRSEFELERLARLGDRLDDGQGETPAGSRGAT